MNFKEATDSHILAVLGERIKQKRLNKNLSQQLLAKRSGISRRTVQAIEAGESISLIKIIALLRTLDSLDALDNFIPETVISPLQLIKLKGRKRIRAYNKTQPGNNNGDHS